MKRLTFAALALSVMARAGCGTGPVALEAQATGGRSCFHRRGLREVRLVILDALDAMKVSSRGRQGLLATWQRCRVHFMRGPRSPLTPSNR
jgi:hypothetical protein